MFKAKKLNLCSHIVHFTPAFIEHRFQGKSLIWLSLKNLDSIPIDQLKVMYAEERQRILETLTRHFPHSIENEAFLFEGLHAIWHEMKRWDEEP